MNKSNTEKTEFPTRKLDPPKRRRVNFMPVGRQVKGSGLLKNGIPLSQQKENSGMKRNVLNVMLGLFVATAFGMAGCGGGGGGGTAAPAGTNSAPVANAGTAQSVVAGAVVTLDGSASSDANGDLLTYSWSFTSKPNGSSAALSSATVAKPTLTPDVAGAYVFNLVVNDGKVNSVAATATVTAVTASVTVEMEPNNSPVTANTPTTGTMMTGQLSSNLDQDWYKVTAASAGTTSVSFTGTGCYNGGSGWSISILDSASTVLASTTVGYPDCSGHLQMGIGAAGTYSASVQARGSYASSNNYSINVSAP
jgi:hypothetical protein